MYPLKADFLNQNCHCSTLDTAALPAFYSPAPHFLSRENLKTISEFIENYEDFLSIPAVRSDFLHANFLEKGIFNSYDFHISAEGPQLIEINSNAGGALLSLLATENMRHCCTGMHRYLPAADFRFDREKLLKMFHAEFRLRFPDRKLTSVAIVDEAPEAQFFYKEFLLTKELLRDHGIKTYIVSPQEIQITNGVAYAAGNPIDFIYNRLTDFYLEKPESKTIRLVFENGIATVSPNPSVHALYAHKSNLITIWDDTFARRMNIPTEKLKRLRIHIPQTVAVAAENRDALWQNRRNWFFKPTDGFGSKGVYRGDKITKKVWEHISTGNYIAQRYIEPEHRQISASEKLKYDIRVYTYGKEILGIAARYYQGQATNFRTPNGGLAMVLVAA